MRSPRTLTSPRGYLSPRWWISAAGRHRWWPSWTHGSRSRWRPRLLRLAWRARAPTVGWGPRRLPNSSASRRDGCGSTRSSWRPSRIVSIARPCGTPLRGSKRWLAAKKAWRL